MKILKQSLNLELRRMIAIISCISIMVPYTPLYVYAEGKISGFWSDAGNYDTSWYDENPNENMYSLEDAADFAGLAVLVDGGNDFEDVTISLSEDIDLSAHMWEPIGYYSTSDNKPFKGTFDGGNYGISC